MDAPSHVAAEWAYYNLQPGERVSIQDRDEGFMDIFREANKIAVSFFDDSFATPKENFEDQEPYEIEYFSEAQILHRGIFIPEGKGIDVREVKRKDYYSINRENSIKGEIREIEMDIKRLKDRIKSTRELIESIRGKAAFGTHDEVVSGEKDFEESDFDENGDFINGEVKIYQEFMIEFSDGTYVVAAFEDDETVGKLSGGFYPENFPENVRPMSDAFIDYNNEKPDYEALVKGYDRISENIDEIVYGKETVEPSPEM